PTSRPRSMIPSSNRPASTSSARVVERTRSAEDFASERDGLVGGQFPALLPGLGEGGLVELRTDQGQRFIVPSSEPAHRASPHLLVERLARGKHPCTSLGPCGKRKHAGEAADDNRVAEPVADLA